MSKAQSYCCFNQLMFEGLVVIAAFSAFFLSNLTKKLIQIILAQRKETGLRAKILNAIKIRKNDVVQLRTKL